MTDVQTFQTRLNAVKQALEEVIHAIGQLAELAAIDSEEVTESPRRPPTKAKASAKPVARSGSNDSAVDPEAPYGRKADGTPKKRRGRPKKVVELEEEEEEEETTKPMKSARKSPNQKKSVASQSKPSSDDLSDDDGDDMSWTDL